MKQVYYGNNGSIEVEISARTAKYPITYNDGNLRGWEIYSVLYDRSIGNTVSASESISSRSRKTQGHAPKGQC